MSLLLACEGGDTDPDSVARLKQQKNATGAGQRGKSVESGEGDLVKPEAFPEKNTGALVVRPAPQCPVHNPIGPAPQLPLDSNPIGPAPQLPLDSNPIGPAPQLPVHNPIGPAPQWPVYNPIGPAPQLPVHNPIGPAPSAQPHRPSSPAPSAQPHRPSSPVSSVLSMRTTDSKDLDVNFRLSASFPPSLDFQDRLSPVSCTDSNDSKDQDIYFRREDATAISTDVNPHLSEKTRCSVCSKTAVKSCLTCCTSYCGDHVKHHYTSPDLQKHTLVEAGDLKKRLCERHHRVLEIFCATDQMAICTLCMFDHIGHNLYPLTDNESQSTNLKSPVNKDLPPPGPVRFTSVTSDSVSLSWGCPDGLAGPRMFRVVWGCGGDQRSLEVDGLSVDVEGLDPGKDYNFSVVTLSDDGSQSPCVSASVQTEVPQPQNLTVDTKSSSASVTWTKPKGLDQASFSISLYAGGECLKTSMKHCQECSFDLQPDTDYTVTIATVLKNGKKSKAISTSISTNDLKQSSVTTTSANLTWRASPEMKPIPHSFLISYHSQGTEPLTVSSDSCSKVITGLKPHTQYTIRVSTKIQNGGESQPATLTITTGKSTLLNTMFGVQFAVSSGKCTRGAFMQLVKVSGSFRRELKCDFVLVIDTEGLKSPELAQQVDSYEHDNELATLVIGLSYVTIINVSMENTTEMKDILQIAVHAFLRIKEVVKKPRCLFVHQNVADVSAHDSNLRDRQKMIGQLNEMTRAAARMERKNANTCFTDVMDYDPEKDSYYIPGLWQGTPPMASVSAGYSEAVYELKRGLISALKDVCSDNKDLLKFWEMTKDLWQALRFENFIFNFRNSLVAEAYSELCQEWNRWEWEFQKEMYNWCLTAEAKISHSGITDLNSEALSINVLMFEAIQKLDVEEEKILNCLKQYLISTRKLHLVEKYRAEFEISANAISLRQKTKASLESTLQATLDVQNGKKHLTMINNYQTRIIETKVLDLLKTCRDKESDLSDEMLRKEFDHMWTETKSEFPCHTLPRKHVATDAFHILQEHFRMFPGHIKQVLIEENLSECGRFPFQVKTPPAGRKKRMSEPVPSNLQTSFPDQSRNLQDISDSVIKDCQNLIFTKVTQKEDYKPEHLQQLLCTIDTELPRDDYDDYDKEWEASLKMHIFGIATREFQKMHNDFIDQNDPQMCLERAKEKFYSEFENLFREEDQCQRKACEFAKNCLEPAVLDYIKKRIGTEIVDEMKYEFDAVNLRTRSEFQHKLLSELLEKNKYEEYKKFIQSYKNFVKDWILEQLVQKMSRDNKLMQMEKALFDRVLKMVTDAITSFTSNPNRVGGAGELIKHICSTLELVFPENALQDVMIMKSTLDRKTKEFAGYLVEHIEEMLQSLNFQYRNVEDIKATRNLRTLENVCSCTNLHLKRGFRLQT
ncbi:hypothetical protein ACEWY4_008461 [Coilia grayii]|uniref:Uncharacterized protein n=1 Tax=Coilia grayii TaxID=363190 RepID=A0ABD1KB08_9TELE